MKAAIRKTSLAPLLAATSLLGMTASYAQTTANYDWSTATASATGTPLNTDRGRISGANDGWGHSSVAGNLSVKNTKPPTGFSGNYVDTGASDSSATRHNDSQFAYLRGKNAKLDDFTVSFVTGSSPAQSLGLPRVTEQAERNHEPTNAEEGAAQRKADENLSLEEKYQAHVATLPPEQQAWEVVLQENLGGFYLPIHQKQKIEGTSTAWDFVQDDPQLPRVLLIGDSVSRAYTLGVRELLAGKANVHRAPANCGPSATGLKKINLWLGDGNWDLILFNFGIHDRSTPLDAYTARLSELVKIMRKTGAKITWANTTPIPDVPKTGQTAASVVERNKAAAKVMKQHRIPSVDLFTCITPHLETVQNPNDVHFRPEGYRMLSEAVAAFIEKELP